MTATKHGIPLTIITGFLGSGKTTLVNHLLQCLIAEGKKVAIIQNEFGASMNGVENAFVTGSDGSVFENVVELAEGCVCCSVRDNFALAVETLAAQKKYDYVLLECSGMADPGKIIAMFWIDADLESDIYLDGVISVVDGKFINRYLRDDIDGADDEARSQQILYQIAYADKVLINKRDLIASESALQSVKKLIQGINAFGEILTTTKSRLQSMRDVLYIRAYDLRKPTNFELLKSQQKVTTHSRAHENTQTVISKTSVVGKVEALISALDDELCHAENCDHEKHAHHHVHDDDEEAAICAHDANIKSLTMEKEGKCVDLERLENWLSELLWNEQYQQTNDGGEQKNETDKQRMDIYRMKAVLPTKDGDNHYLSAVQDLFEIEKGNVRWMHDDKKDKNKCVCRMVTIGKFLDANVLKTGFASIFTE